MKVFWEGKRMCGGEEKEKGLVRYVEGRDGVRV